MEKVSYALGLGIGQQLAQMGASDLNVDEFAQAIKDVLAGNELKVSHREAQGIVEQYFRKKQAAMDAERAAKGKIAKESGEKYLAENAKKEGVVTLPSGLQYKIIKEGKGVMPNDSATVSFDYTGKLIDGTEFDSSKDRQPLELRLDRPGFIAGVTEAIKLMPEGSVWEVYIPYDLAYGSRPAGQQIKPFSALVFELESKKVTNK